MTFLEQNIKGLCARFGVDFLQMLQDFDAESVGELSVIDLQTIAEEYEVDFYSLLFKPLVVFEHLAPRIKAIKLVIMDVDGVLTDGGMYYTESGDQIKKYNTKDGMAIKKSLALGFQFGIISHSSVGEMVKNRAETLGIPNVYVGNEPKMTILKKWCEELKLSLSEVAMIGDDINDMEVMNAVGLRLCPVDAVQPIKVVSDIVLQSKGGKGVVREFVDNYLLPQPLQN
jgi:YrbI family 3-deoxy-D-manno-octulosonate 8-phosphate phosphatase